MIVDAPVESRYGHRNRGRCSGHARRAPRRVGLHAGELASTQAYLASLAAKPSARHVDVRVVTSGDPNDSGLSVRQLERKLRALPVLAWLPRLVPHAPPGAATDDGVSVAFEPMVRWILERHALLKPGRPPGSNARANPFAARLGRNVAAPLQMRLAPISLRTRTRP